MNISIFLLRIQTVLCGSGGANFRRSTGLHVFGRRQPFSPICCRNFGTLPVCKFHDPLPFAPFLKVVCLSSHLHLLFLPSFFQLLPLLTLSQPLMPLRGSIPRG
jgi:hypothetical protein